MSLDKVWEVASALGMPISPDTRVQTSGMECPWDGKFLHGHRDHPHSDAEGTTWDWWHEIGHWLVASEEGQKLPGFGQGMVYDLSDGGPRLKGCGYEEHASAIGIWLQHELGDDPEGARGHADHHSWSTELVDGLYDPHQAHWHEGLDVPVYVRHRVAGRLVAAGFTTPWSRGQPGFAHNKQRKKMNKSELIKEIAYGSGHTQKVVGDVLEMFEILVKGQLAQGNKVQMTGFGTFGVSEYGPREGRNPATGEPMHIPGGVRPTFKAGKALKDAVKG